MRSFERYRRSLVKLALLTPAVIAILRSNAVRAGLVHEPFQLGACVHLALGRSDAERIDELLLNAEMGSFRDDMYWSRIEREPGVLTLPDEFLPILEAARLSKKRRASPLLVLGYGNPHYDNGGFVLSEDALSAFERYVRFVVARCQKCVDQFEVWNEWNSGFGSNPRVQHGDAAAYVRVLESASRAVKAEYPTACVLGGAMAGVDLNWVRAFADAGGLEHLDGFSVHCYTLFKYRDNPENAIRALDALKELLAVSEPRKQIPIFVTEMGWPTNAGRHGVKEDIAAAYIQRFLLLARTRRWIRAVWLYDLLDDGDNAALMEHRFGLARREGQPKPAYEAVRKLARRLSAESGLEAYRFGADGYAVTGTDATGPWMANWRLEAQAAAWPGAYADAAPAPSALRTKELWEALSGFPKYWRHLSGRWQHDTDASI